MDPRIVTLTHILRLNTRLLRHCLDGMSDEAAAARPSSTTNNVAFVARHCCDARFYLLELLGAEAANPLAASPPVKRNPDDAAARVTSIAAVRDAWTSAAHALRDRLELIAADELDRQVPNAPPFPGTDKSVISLLTFLVQHESYHIGQLALLRKYLGFPAMTYD